MAFLSSEVLEAVQLKDSLLVETLLNSTERHTDAGSYALNLSLSLSLSLSLITMLDCIYNCISLHINDPSLCY